MPTTAVTQAITTLTEAEEQLVLSRAQRTDFFTEWQVNSPEILKSDRQALQTLWQRYLYHRSGGHLLENTVMLLLVSPLLTVAGLYDPPFRVRAEESVTLQLTDSEELLQGRLDLLLLCDRLWIIVVESKKTMLSVWTGLPQTLAYLMAAPDLTKPRFAMLTNGDRAYSCRVRMRKSLFRPRCS